MGLGTADFVAIVARDDNHIARSSREHLFQRPGNAVNIQLPSRGIFCSLVELIDQLEVRQKIGSEWRENGNARGNSRQHLLLH